jgi:hypothetical protein
MKHNARASFWKYLEQLPTDVQELAHKNFALMQADERHASIRLKKVGKLWSARVGENYRALAYQTEVGLVWFWIGPHHEYDKFL